MSNSQKLWAVRSKVGAHFEYVILQEEELCLLNFIAQAFKVHGITPQEETVTKLFDWNRTAVGEEAFGAIVRQFATDKEFFLELDISDNAIRAKCETVLYNFLRKQNTLAIFNERDRNLGKVISRKSERAVLSIVMEFLSENYDLKPTDEELLDVALAVVTIFPSMKAVPSSRNGVESLYDPLKRSGELYEKLVYRKRKNKNKKKNSHESDLDDEENSGKSKEELLEYFENCVLPDNKNDLIQILKESVGVRFLDLINDKALIERSFQLYLVLPELVLIDFGILFCEVDENALMSIWPMICEKPKNLLNITLDNVDEYHKLDELHDLLTFVKAFPNHRTKFENAVKSFIIFSNDPSKDPLHLLKGQSDVPRIIIIFNSEDSSTKFYVCIEKSLFSLPMDFTFIQAFDFFFKALKVFNVEADKSISQFLAIFESFVYKMSGNSAKQLTPNSKKNANIVFGGDN